MLYHQVKENSTQQIIFVHGNSQSLQIWNYVIEAGNLANQYTLITVDLPGHGKSFKSEEANNDYSIHGMAAHLKEFISQFSNREYIVVANSLSTNLIGEIGHSLVNCKGFFFTGSSIIGEDLQPADILQPNPNLAAFFTPHPSEEEINNLITDGSSNISLDDKKKYINIFKDSDPVFREEWFASLSKREWTDEIKNLINSRIPVAIVYGEDDHFVYVHYLDKTSLKKWKNQIIMVPEAGHLIQYDQPEAVAKLIEEFAKECFK